MKSVPSDKATNWFTLLFFNGISYGNLFQQSFKKIKRELVFCSEEEEVEGRRRKRRRRTTRRRGRKRRRRKGQFSISYRKTKKPRKVKIVHNNKRTSGGITFPDSS